MVACAVDVVGGIDAVHFVNDDVSLCGIRSTPWNSRGVKKSTTDVMKITCRECRTKLINAVQAMPFVVPEEAAE